MVSSLHSNTRYHSHRMQNFAAHSMIQQEIRHYRNHPRERLRNAFRISRGCLSAERAIPRENTEMHRMPFLLQYRSTGSGRCAQ